MKYLVMAPVAALLLLLQSAKAQESAKLREAMNNRQAAISVCITYFSIFKECSAGEANSLSFAQRAIDRLAKKSAIAAAALAMPSTDVATRLNLNYAIQQTLIGGSCLEIRILRSRYSVQCVRLVLDP